MNQPAFPTDATATLTLQGPAGALETIVEAAEAPERDAVAIVCHPLPTDGGTMHNKVVTMAARALRESGIATVRFNFRGTGASEGSFDQGRGEADDLRAVAAWVREQRPGARLWLAGFSFG
ncbi:MAG TPA: CocE/NonD family hydrolase, partial [Lysobacter sp.]